MAPSSKREINDIKDLWAEPEPAQGQPPSDDASSLEALVVETITALAAKGIAKQDLRQLYALQIAVRRLSRDKVQTEQVERRTGQNPASDVILARTCVIIDLLIQAGFSQEKAAQLMARQLMMTGVLLPESGGDARGWKRLADWHARLVHGQQSHEAVEAYHAFRDEVGDIPADERLTRAVDSRLWDRRKAQ